MTLTIASSLPVAIQTALNLYTIDNINRRIQTIYRAALAELQESFSSINIISVSTTTLVVNNLAFLFTSQQRTIRMIINLIASSTLFAAACEKTQACQEWFEEIKTTLTKTSTEWQKQAVQFQESNTVFTTSITNLQVELATSKEQSASNIKKLEKEKENFAENNLKLTQEIAKLSTEVALTAENNRRLESSLQETSSQKDLFENQLSRFTKLLEDANKLSDPFLIKNSIDFVLKNYLQIENNHNLLLVDSVKELGINQLDLSEKTKALELAITNQTRELVRLTNSIENLTETPKRQLTYEAPLLLKNE